jgi:hypothetical protein
MKKSQLILMGILCITLPACRTALPVEIKYSTTAIIDTSLRAQVDLCKDHLNELRDSAKSAGNFSDAMTIIGGVLGAGGSITATTLQALDSTAHPTARGQTIAAASIGAAGGLLAIISKLVDSPTTSLNKHSKAKVNWFAGQLILDPSMSQQNPDYPKVKTYMLNCQNDAD